MQQQAKLFTQALLTEILFFHPKSNHNNTVLCAMIRKLLKLQFNYLKNILNYLLDKNHEG